MSNWFLYSSMLLVSLLAGCSNRTRDARDFELTMQRLHATSSPDCMEDEVKRLGGPQVACRKIDAYLHDRPRKREERYLAWRVLIDIFLYLPQNRSPNAYQGGRFPPFPLSEAVPVLWQFIGRDEDEQVREHTIHLLSDEFGPDKRNVPLFRRLLESGRESDYARTNCLLGLRDIRSPEAAKVVAAYVASEAEPFETAAVLLREMCYGRPDFIPIISPLLKHPHERVREVARDAIERCRAKPRSSSTAAE